ncbi:MAG: hypothetical protein LAO07_12005 [Acidobacteriia bacterium]|nr:hypothetical protein [Terriglobia bacterium]
MKKLIRRGLRCLFKKKHVSQSLVSARSSSAFPSRWASLVPVKRFVSVEVGHWSLTGVQQRLVKTGGRRVKHARYYCLLLAEEHLTRQRSGSMLRRIAALPLPDG